MPNIFISELFFFVVEKELFPINIYTFVHGVQSSSKNETHYTCRLFAYISDSTFCAFLNLPSNDLIDTLIKF